MNELFRKIQREFKMSKIKCEIEWIHSRLLKASSAFIRDRDISQFAYSGIMKSIHFKLEKSSLFFLHLMKIFKHLSRTDWLKTIKNSESVVAHMYRLSLLIMFASIRSILLSLLRAFDVTKWYEYRKMYISRTVSRHDRVDCWKHFNICWNF